MKKVFKVIGIIFLCVILIIVTICLKTASTLKKAYAAWETDWSDEIGTIYRDIDVDKEEGTGYDLYIPASANKSENQSLILYLHGGGFTSGDKADGEMLCKYFTSKGYICASVNYTLTDGVHDSNYNKMYEQVLSQVTSIKEKASELGYNITEMATSGDSAGGYLALLYAYRAGDDSAIPVKTVFEMSGPTTFDPDEWGITETADVIESVSRLSGKTVTKEMVESGEIDTIIKEISPALLVDSETVPTIVAYGTKDIIVPVNLKYALIGTLDEFGVDYTYIEFTNSGHGMLLDPDKTQEYVDTVNQYLEKYMDNH